MSLTRRDAIKSAAAAMAAVAAPGAAHTLCLPPVEPVDITFRYGKPIELVCISPTTILDMVQAGMMSKDQSRQWLENEYGIPGPLPEES